jgi:hypothetical protein
MYKAQFKSKNPYESWTTIGTYGTDSAAISAALNRKKMGAILVRVIDKNNSVIYSG